MREALVSALATTPLAWIEGMSTTRAAIVGFGAVFLMGAGASAFFGDFVGHEGRIQSLEEWREIHEDTLTGPAMRRVGRLEDAQSVTSDRLERIEVLLACLYYQIERCPDPAPNPPRGR